MQSRYPLIIIPLVFISILTFLLFPRLASPKLPSICGGIANIQCPAGYTCRLDGNYPDAGGVCVSLFARRVTPTPTCRPRPKCLDSIPKCLLPETPDMCPPQFSSVTPPSNSNYICPQTEWIDCMPGPGVKNPRCDPQYLRWAKNNCPGFKGAAY